MTTVLQSWATGWKLALPVVLLATLVSADPPLEDAEIARQNHRCLVCHGRSHIAALGPEERRSMVGTWLGLGSAPESPDTDVRAAHADRHDLAQRPLLLVQPELLASGVHSGLMCIECHPDADRLPHAPRLELSRCGSTCHESVADQFAAGAHSQALDDHEALAPGCATCHGGHDIISATDATAPQNRRRHLLLCGDCHEKHQSSTPAGLDPVANIENYTESAHGKAIISGGLIAAATCVDCHGPHGVFPAGDPRSSVHRDQIPTTCGTCHIGVDEEYVKSIHGQLLADGDERGPVCTDCHTAHSITRADTPPFLLDIVNECGHCHNDIDRPGESSAPGVHRGSYYDTYRASYHGQVSELGSVRAARCSDCHGAHDMLPADNPASRVHPDRLQETCGQSGCHPGANANFVQFDPHADYRDKENFPILFGVWLYFLIVMSSAFGFFGLHSILWFTRSLIERMRYGRPAHKASKRHPIRRFTTMNRINHALVAITFLGLTATGIPLVFSHEAWAMKICDVLGGIEMAGSWHRVFAVLLIINFIVHFIGLAQSAMRRRGSLWHWATGPNSLVPKWRDITDCARMFRWFFRGGEKPKFDRWTYFEKFDYWSEVFGSMIIGGSGLLLWFPMIASKFVPGWAFNVAMIVHGYEALLAIGFIFTIHFFNANLRPDKFPVDDVIFSGRIGEEELKEERPDEYARLLATGQLEELRVPPWPRSQRPAFVLIGLAAMAFGLGLLVLVILGGLDLI